jgi:hypothetical protein
VQGLSDSAVVAAGAAAITVPWWEHAVNSWLPPTVQGIIAAATLIFVVARAINEVRKFFTHEKD